MDSLNSWGRPPKEVFAVAMRHIMRLNDRITNAPRVGAATSVMSLVVMQCRVEPGRIIDNGLAHLGGPITAPPGTDPKVFLGALFPTHQAQLQQFHSEPGSVTVLITVQTESAVHYGIVGIKATSAADKQSDVA